MKYAKRASVAIVAAGVLATPMLLTGTSVAASGPSSSAPTKVFTLVPSVQNNNPEGVGWDPGTQSFFVGATGDGTIYRGTLGNAAVTPYITPGGSSVGTHVSRGRIYVAGGSTGAIRVFDIASRKQVAAFDTGAGGFINDLVVLGNGDVWATDSVRPTLWHVTAAQVSAGTGTPEAVPVGDRIPFDTTPGAFNLNGIVALNDSVLVVVNSSNGNFYRITLDDKRRPGTAPAVAQIQGLNVPGGDGLLIDSGQLVAVTGTPAPRLVFSTLQDNAQQGTVVSTRTDPTLRGPSTVVRANDRYLVVNAAFGQPEPYTLSGLAR
jgi:Cu-Zn family superoxide dismutase